MACGDGLTGSATGRNAADMDHLGDQLSIFSTNMAEFNEENNRLMGLIAANGEYASELAIRIEELAITANEETQDRLSEEWSQLEGSQVSIQGAFDDNDLIVGDLLEIILSDLEYLLTQSDEEVDSELERASAEDFRQIFERLNQIRSDMEVTGSNLILVDEALLEIDDLLNWHVDRGTDATPNTSFLVGVSETGSTSEFGIVLWSQPSSDAVISIVSGDAGEVTVSPDTLTFTNSNWDSMQTVTVTGVDDTDEDGDQTTTITVSGVGDNWIDDGETLMVLTEDDELSTDVAPSAVFVSKWGTQGTGEGEFTAPHGVVVASDGSVYVADLANHRIQKFTSAGVFVRKWGTQGTGDGEFIAPRGIAMASDGGVYVSDRGNDRIQKFTSAGEFVSKWGTYGTGDGEFDYPEGVAVASDGSVYVADSDNNRIQEFTSAGVFVRKWGTQGTGDGQFNIPTGVATASDGSVYVADMLNKRIQKFSVGP